MGIAFAAYEILRGSSVPVIGHHAFVAAVWPTVAGGAAGLVSKLAVYPLDTVKKRVQAQVAFVDAGEIHGLCKRLCYNRLDAAYRALTLVV